jgi:copper chaperone CopZ
MNKILSAYVAVSFASVLSMAAFAGQSAPHAHHHEMPGMHEGNNGHGHEQTHQDETPHHEEHDHPLMTMAPTITQTGEVTAAIAAGGAPVIVDVLGVVCDFCAMAMNKVFGKRDEVTAVHVDLDKKTLSLVIHEGQALSDEQIAALAKKAGYRIAAIRRGTEALGG